ncbi:hypothetical protein A5630_18820 [Mycolicibacterium mucogenicum]|uniref:Uncharacterized protein n=1 Tax=Mycolicibacterium mucogenicum TaxID=56689 RepID=A0A1A3H7G2_MYCMU|nr:hypothetical protein [Mycolicibacterium mucogenicum]OBJ43548.1 hypothetical protein A5630_18820 [Mycolicibacterium mucogenicum]
MIPEGILISRYEVFQVDAATELFITGSIPDRDVPRPAEAYAEACGIIDLRDLDNPVVRK